MANRPKYDPDSIEFHIKDLVEELDEDVFLMEDVLGDRPQGLHQMGYEEQNAASE